MNPQEYKVITTHAHQVSEYIILYIIIHEKSPHIGEINGDV